MKTIKRTIDESVSEALKEKMVLITGPRQTGKTTLAKSITDSFDYFNFDVIEHRASLIEKSWDRKKALIIFDEIHKMKNWKTYLKGIYDSEGINPNIIVTGSARLDTFRKVGDSMAGRYFKYRLHPFDLKELYQQDKKINKEEFLDRLLKMGGFPEPFLKADEMYYNRWKKTHTDSIIRQDLLDLEDIRHISAIETLIELLRSRVGSPISYSSLAVDLQFSPKTIKNWITILENLYIIFKVTPYHKNIARSLLKEPKIYFYDTGQVKGDLGLKLENAVACALLKETNYLEDLFGYDAGLYYLKNKQGNEVDFLVNINDLKYYLIEVKYSDNSLSQNLNYFDKYFINAAKIQLVKNCSREKTFANNIEIRNAADWLADFSFKEINIGS